MSRATQASEMICECSALVEVDPSTGKLKQHHCLRCVHDRKSDAWDDLYKQAKREQSKLGSGIKLVTAMDRVWKRFQEAPS